jgi:hypothetical protein
VIIQLLFIGALLLQAFSHGVASAALINDVRQAEGRPAVPLHSWLLPSLSIKAAAAIASVFWILATVGFLAAALSFTGTLLPGNMWRQLTVAVCVVSTLGIVLFSGIWPGAPNRKLSQIDTAIALVINVVLLVAVAAGYPYMSNV